MRSAGFVVCARHSTATEWLLADHGSGGLVVHVEITSGILEFLECPSRPFPAITITEMTEVRPLVESQRASPRP